MFSLLNELSDLLQKKYVTYDAPLQLNTSSQIAMNRIAHIKEYVKNHYQQTLSLNQMAEELYLTPQYLSRFFKKQLNCTFTQYLTQVRLEQAHNLLMYTSESVTGIALSCGFPNISAFNRAFREHYGSSPNLYRSKNQPRTSNPLPAPEALPPVDFSESEEIGSSIYTRYVTPVAYSKPWSDTINIGSLKNALKVSFHDIFLSSQKNIQVKYVRFYDLFAPEVLPLDEHTGEYDFSALDEILDLFYEAGIYPFIELSPKPLSHPFATEEIGLESHYGVLKEVLRHAIRRFGNAYVSNWRFELWCPHRSDLVYPEDFSAYFRIYKSYQNLIKLLVPRCSLGGCGFNMCASPAAFDHFIESASLEGIRFDFISFYGYSHAEISSVERISSNPLFIFENYINFRRTVQNSIYRNTPTYITELTSTMMQENFSLASCFQSAFLCQNMLPFLNICDCVAYLGFWDDNTDDKLPGNYRYPGFGFLDRSGIPKPAFFAYNFLSRLGRNLVSYGDNYILTCNSDNRFQLLLFHYLHFGEEYCLHPQDSISMKDTYSIFPEREDLLLRFHCADFPKGQYKVVKQSVCRDHGSILDEYIRSFTDSNLPSEDWSRMLFHMNEEDNAYYRHIVVPKREFSYLDITDTLQLELTLASHEVVFYEFVRIS